MLRAIRRLADEQPISLAATFMGAHEFPVEYRERRAEYVDLVVDTMLPAVAREGLAEWCDVFCEQGVFTPEESKRILLAGLAHGLKPRIHADELALSGGSAVAAEVGARSADHLIFVDAAHADLPGRSQRGRDAAAGGRVLPQAGRFAPARMLIERGVAVALATDVNPGGGFTPSMPFVMSLACFAMHMTLEEALVAATINAAASLDRQAGVRQPRTGQDARRRGHRRAAERPGPGRRSRHPRRDQARPRSWRSDAHEPTATANSNPEPQNLEPQNPRTMSFSTLSLHDFIQALASPQPTPGGGTAAAVAGAMGVGLLMMVAGLPRTRGNTDDERSTLAAVRDRLVPLADALEQCADRDSRGVQRGDGRLSPAQGERRGEGRAARRPSPAAMQGGDRGAARDAAAGRGGARIGRNRGAPWAMPRRSATSASARGC